MVMLTSVGSDVHAFCMDAVGLVLCAALIWKICSGLWYAEYTLVREEAQKLAQAPRGIVSPLVLGVGIDDLRRPGSPRQGSRRPTPAAGGGRTTRADADKQAKTHGAKRSVRCHVSEPDFLHVTPLQYADTGRHASEAAYYVGRRCSTQIEERSCPEPATKSR